MTVEGSEQRSGTAREVRPLIIGTRGSDLALWQARRMAAAISDRLGLAAELKIIKTQGDIIQNVAFHKMEGKGFFTKELQAALLDGTVDLVVHSLKDLPTSEPEGLEVIAVPERHRPNDLLLARPDLLRASEDDPLGLPEGAVLGTSSLRRAAQALDANPGIRVEALRGNVPTRVGKLRDGQYDAILAAAAGIERLGLDLDGLDVVHLHPEAFLPAPGQGALAVETRRGDERTRPLVALHDAEVAHTVAAERRLLARLGGGCHMPLGAHAVPHDGGLRLAASFGTVDEDLRHARIARVEVSGADPEAAAEAAYAELERAVPDAVRQARESG